MTARFSGMVRESPAHSAPSGPEESGSASSSTSKRSYVHPSSPRSAYAARCSTGEREWAIGEPRTAAAACDSASVLPAMR